MCWTRRAHAKCYCAALQATHKGVQQHSWMKGAAQPAMWLLGSGAAWVAVLTPRRSAGQRNTAHLAGKALDAPGAHAQLARLWVLLEAAIEGSSYSCCHCTAHDHVLACMESR